MGNVVWYDINVKRNNEVIKVEGLKHPKSREGWDRKWVGIQFRDGGYYMGIYDHYEYRAIKGNRVSKKKYDRERLARFHREGWTLKMSQEEIQLITGIQLTKEEK